MPANRVERLFIECLPITTLVRTGAPRLPAFPLQAFTHTEGIGMEASTTNQTPFCQKVCPSVSHPNIRKLRKVALAQLLPVRAVAARMPIDLLCPIRPLYAPLFERIDRACA